jgi:PAS domain S-box-containing protein
VPEKGRDRAGVRPEDYYRVLVEQAADGIFIASDEGVYLDVNASGHRLLGYEPGELVGKRIADLLLPEDLPRLEATMGALKRQISQTAEWRMKRRDGALLECEVTAQWLSSGVLLGLVRDISARKQVEQKTIASEAQLRSILETAPDTIMSVDRQGTILFINRTMSPLTVEAVVGTSCYDYVPEESRARVKAAIEYVFSSGGFDEYEVLGPPGVDGPRRWSSVRAGPLLDGDKVVCATLCASDITLRKLEEARGRELGDRLQKIASQVPGFLYQFKLRPDGSSCFPYASDRIREIYRVSPDQVQTDASAVFRILHPDDYAGIVESITKSADTLTPWQHEYRVRFENGDVRWLYGNSVPERQTDGSVLWHGFITDVTQQKEAEQRKIQLEEQLRQSQKVESIGRLAGGVAHDFNNLLTSVLGFTALAAMDLPRGSEAASHLECVTEAAMRGAALTQQLLAFARKKIVNPEVLELNEVVSKMVPMLRRLVGEHLELSLELAPSLGAVKVDAGSVEQVVMNLVVNARDALSAGGQITLRTAEVTLDEVACRAHAETLPGDYVVLTVSDNGTGMAPEVQSRLFEPFFTTKPVGEGTGLGLAMCHGIVKQARGTIAVQSEFGKGSSFQVYLPRVHGERASVRPARASLEAARGRETVLLVEDEAMIVRLAREALSGMGYRVLTATDGVEALELAEGFPEPIDLLITDVVMPRLGGRELATRLVTLRPGIKVLYSSGYTENAIVDHGVLEKGVHFLHKPYRLTELAARVREVLESEPS